MAASEIDMSLCSLSSETSTSSLISIEGVVEDLESRLTKRCPKCEERVTKVIDYSVRSSLEKYSCGEHETTFPQMVFDHTMVLRGTTNEGEEERLEIEVKDRDGSQMFSLPALMALSDGLSEGRAAQRVKTHHRGRCYKVLLERVEDEDGTVVHTALEIDRVVA